LLLTRGINAAINISKSRAIRHFADVRTGGTADRTAAATPDSAADRTQAGGVLSAELSQLLSHGYVAYIVGYGVIAMVCGVYAVFRASSS
jgi:proline racemase